VRFSSLLLAWFERHGRKTLPWRTSRDPYRVVVSEFMLQQTQVDRVLPIFERFVGAWPSFAALSAASRAEVVRAWQGLGYNSRAVRLHKLACEVRERFGGDLPRDEESLRSLPGVGLYTARAIAAFAFDLPVVALDTNVRRIIHRTQLGLEWPRLAADAELDALAARVAPGDAGFAFNSALMDLGASLCSARAPKCLLCPLQTACAAAPVDAGELATRAAAHAKYRGPQERLRFEETRRYLRGRVVDRLRALPAGRRISLLDLQGELVPALPHHDARSVAAVVADLAKEGLVESTAGGVRLAS